MSSIAPVLKPSNTVEVIRGQLHKFMLIPILRHHARFDCFDRTPHYHYILNADQHNILWGYDAGMNGPMLAWAIARLRERLPDILRGAGEDALAARVEREGFDGSVLDAVERATLEAHASTVPGTELALEGRAWMARWKEIHPQFNTVDA